MQREDQRQALRELVCNAPPLPTSAFCLRRNMEHEYGHEPSFRDFLFSFNTLEFPLRVLTGIVLAEVSSAVLLIAAIDFLSFPTITIHVGHGGLFSLPLAVV
jgi:hypothetical protein